MEAIYDGPNGDAWKKSRIQIYGWENFSWNISTSTPVRRPNANFPLIYDLRPNRIEQNQFVLYLEARAGRKPDRSYRLGFSNLGALWTRLSFHDFARTLQRSAAEAQQLLRLRYADGIFRSLPSGHLSRHECSDWTNHFRARHRSAARAEQSHVEPLDCLRLRQLTPRPEFSRPRRSTISGQSRLAFPMAPTSRFGRTIPAVSRPARS